VRKTIYRCQRKPTAKLKQKWKNKSELNKKINKEKLWGVLGGFIVLVLAAA
jgi:hypothetical protein